MRKTHYLLLVVILFAFHVQSFAYGESEDEFDEIAGQLQGMKAVIENMSLKGQSFTSTIPPNDSPPGQTEKMPALPMDGL